MTWSKRQFRLLPEGPHQCWSALHGSQSVASVGLQVRHVDGASVGQLVMLQVPPDVLGRIELWRIGRERCDLYGPIEGFEVLAHHGATMNRCTIPNDQQWLPYLLTQSVQKFDELRA